MTQANPKNKVCIDRYEALIPYVNCRKNGTKYNTGYTSSDLTLPLNIVKDLDNNEVLCRSLVTGKHVVVNAKDLYIKLIVVLFKDIEAYAHYQTEIEFNSDEHI